MKTRTLTIMAIALVIGCGEADKKVADNSPPDAASSENTPPESETATSGSEASESVPEWAQGIDLTSVDVREEVERVGKVFEDARELFIEKYNAASKAEKKEMRSAYPKPDDYVAHVERLIEARDSDDAISAAYAFLATNKRGDDADEALDVLFDRFAESEDLKGLFFPLVYTAPSQKAEDRISIMMKSPHEEVRGAGTYAMAEFLKQLGEMKGQLDRMSSMGDQYDLEYIKSREVDPADLEKLYQTVVDEYASIELMDKPIGEKASGALFALKHLAVGKSAPDIEGEDIDGETFSLSEYRGKVVMLDFWGDW